MKVLIITSGQPSLNPRIVKEADALSDAGHEVTVLYAYWNAWGTRLDQELLASKKWIAKRVGGVPGSLTYLISRVLHKMATLMNEKSKGKRLAELAIARSSYFLVREAKKHRADLYIAHNLGALPAAVQAAAKYHKTCGFDAEDFHRYETTNDDTDPNVILKKALEDAYIPQLSYFTASSPGIAEAYKKIYPAIQPVVLLNVFGKAENIDPPKNNDAKELHLLWFSQTIGRGRGIEDVINALKELNNAGIHLHLLGYPARGYLDKLDAITLNIHIHEPLPPGDIPHFASRFDIGLSLEAKQPLNRDICLPNKIFTYLQAGLAVIATDTSAQKALLKEYKEIGEIYAAGDSRQLAGIINGFYNDREALLKAKQASYISARTTLNWETESATLLKITNQLLQD